eukprot:3128735-Pyramimonas_sp.AAC.1
MAPGPLLIASSAVGFKTPAASCGPSVFGVGDEKEEAGVSVYATPSPDMPVPASGTCVPAWLVRAVDGNGDAGCDVNTSC